MIARHLFFPSKGELPVIILRRNKVESTQGDKVTNKKKERNKNNTNTKIKTTQTQNTRKNRKKAGVRAGMNQKL
jgi:hypothetical protein